MGFWPMYTSCLFLYNTVLLLVVRSEIFTFTLWKLPEKESTTPRREYCKEQEWETTFVRISFSLLKILCVMNSNNQPCNILKRSYYLIILTEHSSQNTGFMWFLKFLKVEWEAPSCETSSQFHFGSRSCLPLRWDLKLSQVTMNHPLVTVQ